MWEILPLSSIALSAIIFVSVVWMNSTILRIVNRTQSRTMASASAIFGLAVYSGIVVISSQLALATIATVLAMRVFIRLWVSSQPTNSPARHSDGIIGPQWAARLRGALIYVVLLATAALVEPGGTLRQAERIISEVLAQDLGWITLGASVIVVAVILQSERTSSNVTHAGLCAVSVFCAALVLSRRPAFSALIALWLMGGLFAASRLHYKYFRTSLHAYDIFYYLANLATPRFFFKNIRAVAQPSLGAAGGALMLSSVVWVIEPALVDRSRALVALSIAATAFVISKVFVAQRDYMSHFVGFGHITIFLSSAVETIYACRHGGVFATHGPATVPTLSAEPAIHSSPRKAPQIIVIQNESTFPPWIYGKLDPSINDFFRSIDGKTRQLRVETYGGMSWVTEFSMLTGIPASSYGPFRPHVFRWATGRFKHSLPYCLKQCGYRTAAVYPAEQDFVNMGNFYRSIGFEEIVDRPMLGTDCDRERDSFYHEHALGWLGRHFASTDQPAFLFVVTMSNHSPHDCGFAELGAGPRSNGATGADEFGEYMRRLHLSRDDYARFRTELARRFPDREFLIVHFGDHQPPFTSRMVERRPWRGILAEFPKDELAYRTYFAIDGVNFQPHTDDRVPDVIEIAYLGTVILAAAGIPLDSVHELRRELMTRHFGRLFFADDDGTIAKQLNGRLIEAGLITPH
jgi:Sulfatase